MAMYHHADFLNFLKMTQASVMKQFFDKEKGLMSGFLK